MQRSPNGLKDNGKRGPTQQKRRALWERQSENSGR